MYRTMAPLHKICVWTQIRKIKRNPLMRDSDWLKLNLRLIFWFAFKRKFYATGPIRQSIWLWVLTLGSGQKVWTFYSPMDFAFLSSSFRIKSSGKLLLVFRIKLSIHMFQRFMRYITLTHPYDAPPLLWIRKLQGCSRGRFNGGRRRKDSWSSEAPPDRTHQSGGQSRHAELFDQFHPRSPGPNLWVIYFFNLFNQDTHFAIMLK